MRYIRFLINNYRAISGPLEIKLGGGGLTPIIGVNESGKTTVLHAIFAFDYLNDNLNDSGRHLKDVSNLYRAASPPATVAAEIELSHNEFRSALASCEKQYPAHKVFFGKVRRKRTLSTKLVVKRIITTGKYVINDSFGEPLFQDVIARSLVARMPYILYFDDFRDKIAEKVEIPANELETLSDWPAIIEQLFVETDKAFSIFKLLKMEVRQRKTVLAKVQRHLNDTLTREWQSFRLDDRDALKISIDFEQEGMTPVRNYVKLEVVETDSNGDEHFFFISDRSKGFYWFFNFVMKLEFNPKITGNGDVHSIYLLDEPGSYLHAFAQRKLCAKLRQISEKNRVIYCTHSHYLLDPDTIPIASIVVADKDGNGNVTLTRMIDFRKSGVGHRSALQPVLDALEIKPYSLDLIHDQTTIIVEGIYDYLSLELFRGDRVVSIVPSVGAESIKYYISLMIGWQVQFRALWDDDPEGRKRFREATELFGTGVGDPFFRLLPNSGTGKRIMQDLFEGSDLSAIRNELGLSSDCSFERTVHALFYSTSRAKLVGAVSSQTKANFEMLFDSLGLQRG